MDLAALPGLGVAGALVIVIGYLLASNRNDREQHRKSLEAEQIEHAKDLAARDTRIDTLEARVKNLERAIEAERRLRWKAEDEAAKWRRAAEAS